MGKFNSNNELCIEERLRRSEQMSYKEYEAKVFNGKVEPNWINDSDVFWYAINTREGKRFYRVDIEKQKKELLFDHVKMANGLKNAGMTCEESNIPIDRITFDFETAWTLSIGFDQYSCDLNTYNCKKINTVNSMDSAGKSYSPNGKFYVFIKEHNLYLKDDEKDEETQLTFDGIENYSYGTYAGTGMMTATMKRDGKKMPPAVLWSPDGTKFISHKTDERNSVEMTLLQSAVPYGELPKAYTYRTTLTGGEISKAELIAFDTSTKERIEIDIEPIELSITGSPFNPIIPQTWFVGEDIIYILYLNRGSTSHKLCRFDFNTGKMMDLIRETADTFTQISPALYYSIIRNTTDNKEVIAYSDRNGWGHLYLYDAETGEMKNQITEGEYVVTDIIHIDESDRVVFFTACGKEEGRNPYDDYLYRINFDGSDLRLLTPEDAFHVVKDMGMSINKVKYNVSPSGKYFIDSFSKVNVAPQIVIRNREGNLVMILEKADITRLKEVGWIEPEPFCVKARDGETNIYGVIYKPSHFDPNKKYPVIDNIYPGPQITITPRTFFHKAEGKVSGAVYSLAELGFIVIHVDGMGTPFRSRAFHEFAYNNMQDATIPDHITAIRQLAEERDYMDIENVGIYGNSAGGYATCLAMFNHGNFYKVGIASNSYVSPKYYRYSWAERYMESPYNEEKYAETCLLKMVDGLKGRFMIMTGDFDENINAPSQIMLADALIKARKDFDIFIAPNSGHGMEGNEYATTRKMYGYFLKHLRGEEIPFDIEYPTTI